MAVMTIAVASSCAAPQKSHVERFQGHWASGDGYSFFILLDHTTKYGIFADDISEEARNYLMRQPMHQCPFSSTRDCRAVYLEVLGAIEEYKGSTPGITTHLHVSKILKMEPAHAEFFKSSKHPLP